MNTLDEIKSGGIVAVKILDHAENPAIVYILKSGKKIMVDSYGNVTIGLLDITRWYAWRIKRALRKAAR